jgi:hypothetical protein
MACLIAPINGAASWFVQGAYSMVATGIEPRAEKDEHCVLRDRASAVQGGLVS